ncbi:prephenate dehydrogenase/arogenate dehydrogenase family protein [Muricoccus radiodurans]|uniref:prephenate dehydrogenase/arogenate dehydrogenase family protein n=1 Tax=Muricoccus radiodurans TaxID=2231721 RepID=UPI003CE88EDC
MSAHVSERPPVGIIGFGAFGQLMARHLAPHVPLLAYDPRLTSGGGGGGEAVIAPLAEVAHCPIVVLAGPVSRFEEMTRAIGPHLRPGAIVLDVGSVKTIPVEIMRRNLPAHAEIVGTHPLFGPQSARDGIRGLKVAVCPVRGRGGRRIAAFLRRALGLDVILTMPAAHDREVATAQGLTHLIAKVLVQMEPLPSRMTTRSFDLIMTAVGMVRHDAPEVFQAIEGANPFAREVRQRFFGLASDLAAELDRPVMRRPELLSDFRGAAGSETRRGLPERSVPDDADLPSEAASAIPAIAGGA